MFYDKKWKQEGFWIHFEWFPLSYDNLFDKEQTLKLELHIEGKSDKKGDFVKSLLGNAKNIYLQERGRTYYSKTFSIPDGKSFVELSSEERKSSLIEFYHSDDIKNITELIKKTIEKNEVI